MQHEQQLLLQNTEQQHMLTNNLKTHAHNIMTLHKMQSSMPTTATPDQHIPAFTLGADVHVETMLMKVSNTYTCSLALMQWPNTHVRKQMLSM
jgi:hypothetical protein